ncbi:ADP-ribosyl cyclase/cyclic ADP-ribose hydrolase [Raphanus sativus]|nr:ADP-ribosyl cyclase/cyclic ADP-ribose hydrolase [Raphanus sativus]
MFLSGTAIKEVPSSIRLWPHLDELHLSYNENLKEIPFPHVLHTMTAAERQSMYLFHRIKQNGLEDVPWNGRTNVLSRHLTEHLYIFEFRADVTSDELCFEFMVKEEWTIKECGVHYLNTRYKQVYSRKRKRVETCESGDEVAEEEVDSVRLEE